MVPATGVWSHIVGLWDGTNIYSFVNGANKVTTAAATIVSLATGDVGLFAGKTGTVQFAPGSLGEVCFWNGVALTDSEVAALANGVAPQFVHPDGLTLYWPLFGDSPEPDYSGSRNSGTVTGSTVVAHPPVYGRLLRSTPPLVTPSGAVTTISAAVAAAASVSATVVRVRARSATSNAAATVAASVVRVRARSATATAAAAVTGAVVRTRTFTAAAAATATAACAVVRLRARAATVNATATVTAAIVRTGALTATANARATVSATVVRTRTAAATATARATVTAAVVRTRPLTGSALATATVSCSAVRTRGRSATVAATSTAIASVIRVRVLAPAVTATATVDATVSVVSASGQSSTDGQLLLTDAPWATITATAFSPAVQLTDRAAATLGIRTGG